jgi:hypothetical protein
MISFGEKRSGVLNRHHFAVGGYVNEDLGGWITCLEMDSETCYIQYGGSLPNFSKSIHVVAGYCKMINLLREKYERAWTRIENTNIPMLKMAMALGFLITGTYNFNNKIYLELTNNFKEE